MVFLNASGDEELILTAVFQRAIDLDTERRVAEIKAIARAIGQSAASAVVKMMGG